MSVTINSKLVDYIKVLVKKQVKTEGEFSKRIRSRHSNFWKDPEAEEVKNTVMYAHDPLEKWVDVENWQRKLSNKHNSREFAKMHNAKVPQLYWKGRDFSTLNFDQLPNQYVIRPTVGHSSGMVFLMNNSVNLMDGQTYSNDDIKQILQTALEQNIKPEFLFEEFLRNEQGEYKIPDDYKFYTFDGEVATIQVINRLGPSKGFTTCYNENWQIMENVNTYYGKGSYLSAPACFAEMLDKAKQLSKAYEIFVRVDFYATDKGAVFGEFTPTPFLGSHFTPNAHTLFVDYWDRFCKGKI